jgi:hypothetical protein
MIENRRNLRMWQFICLPKPLQTFTPAPVICKLVQTKDAWRSIPEARDDHGHAEVGRATPRKENSSRVGAGGRQSPVGFSG